MSSIRFLHLDSTPDLRNCVLCFLPHPKRQDSHPPVPVQKARPLPRRDCGSARGHDHVRSRTREATADLEPEPRVATGDDHHLPAQIDPAEHLSGRAVVAESRNDRVLGRHGRGFTIRLSPISSLLCVAVCVVNLHLQQYVERARYRSWHAAPGAEHRRGKKCGHRVQLLDVRPEVGGRVTHRTTPPRFRPVRVGRPSGLACYRRLNGGYLSVSSSVA